MVHLGQLDIMKLYKNVLKLICNMTLNFSNNNPMLSCPTVKTVNKQIQPTGDKQKSELSMIDQIVDMIVREALGRKGSLPAKIAEVNIEVMLKVMEIMDDHLEGERREARRKL